MKILAYLMILCIFVFVFTGCANQVAGPQKQTLTTTGSENNANSANPNQPGTNGVPNSVEPPVAGGFGISADNTVDDNIADNPDLGNVTSPDVDTTGLS